MLLIKLAIRNITHAGIRTWLNVFVLSVAFVAIVLTEGLYEGAAQQVRDIEIDLNTGGGQFWQKDYDPYNPFTLYISHSRITSELEAEIKKGNATPLLITPAAIFPQHQIRSVLIKGIEPNQKTIGLPTFLLNENIDSLAIPGLIGSRMAKNTGLKEGDYVSTRWRNKNGTFDAADIKIVKVINVNSPLIDKDQIWIPLNKLQEMMQTPGEASIIILNKDARTILSDNKDWIFRDQDYLLKDININIQRKRIHSTFIYIILLGMALLAVFDTQVLSIFKRRKEIGTLLALGMTKKNIIGLFTLEGCLTGILAFIVGSVYGIPLLTYLANEGILLPKMVEQSQFALGLTLYPKYGIQLYFVTALILFLSVIVVSYLPTRRIAKLKPNDALKGRLT